MNIPSDHLPDAPLSLWERCDQLLTIQLQNLQNLQNGVVDQKTSNELTRLVDRQTEIIRGGR